MFSIFQLLYRKATIAVHEKHFREMSELKKTFLRIVCKEVKTEVVDSHGKATKTLIQKFKKQSHPQTCAKQSLKSHTTKNISHCVLVELI